MIMYSTKQTNDHYNSGNQGWNLAVARSPKAT